MVESEKSESIIKYKMLYSVIILILYLVMRCVPLYGIDITANTILNVDAQSILTQTISGDMNRMSILALGISPYMMASIIMMVVNVYQNTGSKMRTSPKKLNKITLAFALTFAVVQAIIRANELVYMYSGDQLMVAKIVSAIEMITGAMLIIWICDRNKKYGIGGQTIIICVNIITGIMTTLGSNNIGDLLIPLLIGLLELIVIMYMENTEKRIAVQRISIHNIYAEKNYLAIKINPIGVMPIMFAASFFMIPQMIISLLEYVFPENANLLWVQENVVLTRPLGITIYIAILYILTIGFSFVFINPKEMTDQFLKSGDSIADIHAGKDTRRYLSRSVRRISIFSATIMSICIGIPMVLQLQGTIDNELVMFPSSIMMIAGIWCNLYREYISVKNFDLYKPFI